MNTSPPWSLRLATHPVRMASLPTSDLRSTPQVCVRFSMANSYSLSHVSLSIFASLRTLESSSLPISPLCGLGTLKVISPFTINWCFPPEPPAVLLGTAQVSLHLRRHPQNQESRRRMSRRRKGFHTWPFSLRQLC